MADQVVVTPNDPADRAVAKRLQDFLNWRVAEIGDEMLRRWERLVRLGKERGRGSPWPGVPLLQRMTVKQLVGHG